MKIRTISGVLKETYGCKVYKLSLQSGCTCPTRDGTKGVGGCTFCSAGGSGEFASPLMSIPEQLKAAKARVDAKMPEGERKYIAYFQSYTNTYAPVSYLRELFAKALEPEEIVGLSVGTRPDCLPDEVVSLLAELNQTKPVWIELGLQTIHEKTARAIHRGYELSVFEDAYRRLTAAGLTVIVHMILYLPGESEEDMLESMHYLAALNPRLDGIKLHLLHVLKGTQLARDYEETPFPLPTMQAYTDMVVRCLKVLPEETVIHRLTGDGPKKLLMAPLWSADKKRVLNMLKQKIEEA